MTDEVILPAEPTVVGSGNKYIILITGVPTSGKTSSLYPLWEDHSIAYLNTDMKELPFRNKFRVVDIKDPLVILDAIDQIEQHQAINMGCLDTITHLMNMYETLYVNGSTNTQKAWGNYASFYKLVLHKIKAGSKKYVIFTHEADKLDEKAMQMDTRAPIKGSVGKVGIEADFSIILSAKKVSLKQLEGWENSLLNITDEDIENGYKYVFATRTDKDSIGEKTRSPMGMWKRSEKYIDNNINQVMHRIEEYYS